MSKTIDVAALPLRNPVHTHDGSIDCEIEHPEFGWIPFTASEDDSEMYGALIYARALKAGPAPTPPHKQKKAKPAGDKRLLDVMEIAEILGITIDAKDAAERLATIRARNAAK